MLWGNNLLRTLATDWHTKVKVLFHKTAPTDYADRLREAITSVVEAEQVCVTGDTEAFLRALLKYCAEMPIVVIHLCTVADVTEIEGLSDILDGLFLIIAVDSDKEGLLISCRQFYPRLLADYREDLSVIAAVIRKRMAIDNHRCYGYKIIV